MSRIGLKGLCMALCVVFLLAGCKGTGESFKKSDRRSEPLEYNCLHHAKDGICEVPWKDKTVLYCVKGKVKKVVRFREEC